ncbi:SH3 and multiple ankyrin repeat domains protein 1-like [Triticum dicoccoides]|uniref:SH3 and multiple ankyrin repeat domains protein 1-like n=1 Tax=Triticum dicoccoides TaxID=85692 RepID=UPI0018913D53|nr:SH3 and multiple ankyrin repeat domains protein 1-like [Triticum dicoccoides]
MAAPAPVQPPCSGEVSSPSRAASPVQLGCLPRAARLPRPASKASSARHPLHRHGKKPPHHPLHRHGAHAPPPTLCPHGSTRHQPPPPPQQPSPSSVAPPWRMVLGSDPRPTLWPTASCELGHVDRRSYVASFSVCHKHTCTPPSVLSLSVGFGRPCLPHLRHTESRLYSEVAAAPRHNGNEQEDPCQLWFTAGRGPSSTSSPLLSMVTRKL